MANLAYPVCRGWQAPRVYYVGKLAGRAGDIVYRDLGGSKCPLYRHPIALKGSLVNSSEEPAQRL